jgi:recombinational DNA repair ATPase RecF
VDGPRAVTRRSAQETESRDRLFGNTETGPHRADLAIYLEGTECMRKHPRAAKLAAAHWFSSGDLVRPRAGGSALLIDDPAAELTGAALERLLLALDTVGAQLILTGLRPRNSRRTRLRQCSRGTWRGARAIIAHLPS